MKTQWTQKERNMTKAGYCYTTLRGGFNTSGLKGVVRSLQGKERKDVEFDVHAYNTHKEMGIV